MLLSRHLLRMSVLYASDYRVITMHRLTWTACGLWMLLLVCSVLHKDRCVAYGDFRLHYKPHHPASGFINRTVSQAILSETIAYADDMAGKMQRLESSISQSRIRLARDSTSYALLLDSLPDERSKLQDRQAQIALKASVQLLNGHCLSLRGQTEAECARDIETVPLPETSLPLAICRTLQNSTTPNTYRRLLPAAYADGLQRMHHAHSQPLPKTISDRLYGPRSDADPNGDRKQPAAAIASVDGPADGVRNIAVVQWSQFVEHDLAKTVFRTMDNNVPIECCDSGFRDAAPRYRHPACAPLMVEPSSSHISCLNYVRSALGVSAKCTFGPAQQRNQATSQLDLSQLYGHGEPLASQVRRFSDGELLTNQNDRDGGETLPEAKPSAQLCMPDQRQGDSGHETTAASDIGNTCYQSGDSRCNANPFVTPLYTLFLRSHNRIARSIRRRKPNWTDTRIYQKARRLNTAVYTRLVFNEWLPVVVGAELATELNMAHTRPASSAVVAEPDAAAVSNEWATAAARFYYSMMPGALRLDAALVLDVQQEFYRPRNLGANGTLDRMVAAIVREPAMAMDSAYVEDVSKFLYRTAGQEIGTDALALDIQRGRDHGLAGYTHYVELCTGRTITEWEQLRPTMTDTTVERLRTIYKRPHHIDLIVGGIAETPQPGATVGPTFACLIGEQFDRTLRSGRGGVDQRYDGLLRGRYGGANFVCEHTGLASVPQNVFHVPSDENPLVECATLPTLCEIFSMCGAM